ncbi:MAG: response regulator [Bacteroidetes bacterium]|nr:response regulator [Bacteroidota bacterium]
MKNNHYKVDIEIYVVFIVVIGISIFNAIYSSLNITKNQEVNNKIMTVDIPSLQAMETMNLLVTRSEMYSTNWAYILSNKEDKEKLKSLQDAEYPELRKKIEKLLPAWKDRESVENMNTIFKDFDKILEDQKQIMKILATFDDYQDPMKKFSADEIVESQIIPKSTEIISRLNNMVNRKKEQTEMLHFEMRSSYRSLMWSVLGIAIMVVVVILLAAFYLSNNIIVPLMKLKNYILQMGKGEIPEIAVSMKRNAVGLMTEAVRKLAESLKKTASFAHNIGEGNFKVEFQPLGSNDELGNALIQMRESLSMADSENKQRHWMASGLEQLNSALRENTDDLEKLSDEIINSLVKFLNVHNGAMYVVEKDHMNEKPYIQLCGSYAMDENQSARKKIEMGEGLIGQALKNKETIYLKDVPLGYLSINSGLGKASASHILIIPLSHRGEIYGVIELASFRKFQDEEIKFIEGIGETMGSTIAASKTNTLTKKLLDETRKQAERLAAQDEELRQTNDELSHQSSLLQASEEELKQSNTELKDKAKLVEEQNERLGQTRDALSIKVKELELNSKFKSEFLANMSHELRTPLNSVLILAKLLSDNKNKTFTEKEIEYARVIHKSGNDLLLLINDVLDLSKIEAGKLELMLERESVKGIKDDLYSLFSEVANQKKIEFSLELHSNIPNEIITDKVRLEQILKNLLSNAFKFTSANGTVTLKIKRPDKSIQYNNPAIFRNNELIEFAVTDSGIGIPREKQQLIFEAFQQVDGSTSRKYGGTGLGLSISRMLVALLGGEMHLVSEEGKGSTFSIFLPVRSVQTEIDEPELSVIDSVVSNTGQEPAENDPEGNLLATAEVADDRETLTTEDKIVLIVEDDLNFAKVLVDFAHEKNYKAVVATHGDEGLLLADRVNPSAIILDMQLPVIDGWSVLKKIQENPKLMNIPVHVMSAMDRRELGLEMGATTYLRKPLDKRDLDKTFSDIEKSIDADVKKVLIVENDLLQFEILRNLIVSKERNTKIFSAGSQEEVFKIINSESINCIILNLDFGSKHYNGFEILEQLKSNDKSSLLPVIVYTGEEINEEEEKQVKKFTNSVVQKNDESLNRILDETRLFLHRLNDEKEAVVRNQLPGKMNELLNGKSVLLVDDDMRNIYALTSALEGQGMNVIAACDGMDALAKIEKHKGLSIILMDIMMPEMDGYTAIQEIRKMDGYKSIPIIAQTAKAMKGDREKCIQSGASDYISKPINIEQLLSLMRVWLYKE